MPTPEITPSDALAEMSVEVLALDGFSHEAVDWKKYNRVHNWRNYVPDEVRAVWRSLGPEGRISVAFMAEAQAEHEDWD